MSSKIRRPPATPRFDVDRPKDWQPSIRSKEEVDDLWWDQMLNKGQRGANWLADLLFGATPEEEAQNAILSLVAPMGTVQDVGRRVLSNIAGPTQRRLLPSAQKIISYHGTPESGFAPTSRNPLGEFNLNKIGSGEGSQIKGKGLYMSSDPEIADWYRRMLSQSGIGPSPNRGSLFEVGIRSSPEELIDLDKPLTDQSHQVQSVVRSIFDPLQPKSYEMVTESGLPSGRMGRDVGRPGSEYLEHTLFESPETALDAYSTQLLKEKGVPGAQYIGRTSGKRNYVVWDPDRLHILRKLITGVGAVGTGAAAGSQN